MKKFTEMYFEIEKITDMSFQIWKSVCEQITFSIPTKG